MKWEQDEQKKKYINYRFFLVRISVFIFQDFWFFVPSFLIRTKSFFFFSHLGCFFFGVVYSPSGYCIFLAWNSAYVLKYLVLLFKMRKKRFKVFGKPLSHYMCMCVYVCSMHHKILALFLLCMHFDTIEMRLNIFCSANYAYFYCNNEHRSRWIHGIQNDFVKLEMLVLLSLEKAKKPRKFI